MKYLLAIFLLLPNICNAGISYSINKYDLAVKALKTPPDELKCLTETLYYESRSEPAQGILNVAMVVLNRKANPRYPKTICKVVKQQLVKGIWQFSFWKEKHLLKKKIDKKSWNRVESIAKVALMAHAVGYDPTKGSEYYYNPRAANPSWARSPKLRFVVKVGQHKFYRRIKK